MVRGCGVCACFTVVDPCFTFFETVHLGMKPYVEKIHAFSKVQSPVQFVLIPTNFESMFCTIAMR